MRAILAALLLASPCLGEEIPLDSVWAYNMPGTKDVRELERQRTGSGALSKQILSKLHSTEKTDNHPQAGFVVLGTGADGNGDGVIDAADYTVWRDNLASSASVPVPEPAAVLLLAIGFLWKRGRPDRREPVRRQTPQSL